jgi:hypothetical protein
MSLIALVGMVGGPQAAHQALENLNNDVVGGAAGGFLQLPPARDKETMEATLKWGFVWENPAMYESNSRRRELTSKVAVPAGWRVESTDHWLYKKLMDPQGRNRAQLMIHHQDGDSWLSLERPYRGTSWSANHGDDEFSWPVVMDSNGTVLWVGRRHEPDGDFNKRHAAYWQEFRKKNEGKKYDTRRHEKAEKDAPKRNSERARDTARELLAKLTEGQPADRDYFDEPLEFPASLDTLPVLQTYTLRCEYRYRDEHDGYADSGSSTLRAATDDEAKAIVEKRWNGRGMGYRRIYKLVDPAGVTIGNWEDKRVMPQRRFHHDHGLRYPGGDYID